MSKSKGNFYNLSSIVKRGYSPLALKYYYLTAKYRSYLNFSWEGLKSASNAYNQLRKLVIEIKDSQNKGRTMLSSEKLDKIDKFRDSFTQSLEDDLNTPQSLAVVWKVLKSNIPDVDKYELLQLFDQVLGLSITEVTKVKKQIPQSILKLARKRQEYRNKGEFDKSDQVRDEIIQNGYLIKDKNGGYDIEKK